MNPNPKRDSFVNFAAAQFRQDLETTTSSEQRVAPPSAQSVRDGTQTWDRLAHATHLLGYALAMSFFGLLYLFYLASIPWGEDDGNGVQLLDKWLVLRGLWTPGFAAFTVVSWANISQYSNIFSQYDVLDFGPKYARVNLIVGAACVFLNYGSVALLLSTGVDAKYWVADVLVAAFWMVVLIAAEMSLRAKWGERDLKIRKQHGTESNVADQNSAAGQEGMAAAAKALLPRVNAGLNPGETSEPTTQKTENKLLGLVPMIATLSVMLLYPFLVIPTFWSGTVTTRMLICLLLHPVLLEAGEALGRSAKGGVTAEALAKGSITFDFAEQQIVQTSLTSFAFKQLMAFFRRFMLLNMGSPDATIAAVVAASMEEAVERGFLVEFDQALRKLRGMPKLQGDELRLQRLVWMCDANQSAIAELNAILVSSFAQILLGRHAQFIALGYTPGEPLDPVVVFVQLLVELALEAAVDMIAMWSEKEHGIPVTHYFRLVHSSKFFVFHAAAGVGLTGTALYAFIRHPNFL